MIRSCVWAELTLNHTQLAQMSSCHRFCRFLAGSFARAASSPSSEWGCHGPQVPLAKKPTQKGLFSSYYGGSRSRIEMFQHAESKSLSRQARNKDTAIPAVFVHSIRYILRKNGGGLIPELLTSAGRSFSPMHFTVLRPRPRTGMASCGYQSCRAVEASLATQCGT